MKQFAKFWWLWGVGSGLCAFLSPYIGWYAVGNLAVVLCGFYLMHLAAGIRKTRQKNSNVIRRMNKKQKDQLRLMEARERQQTTLLSERLMPFITLICGLLNCYTFYYMKSGQKTFQILEGISPEDMTLNFALLALDLCFLLLFWFSFRTRIREELKASG